MNSLQQAIAEKEQQIRMSQRELQDQRAQLGDSVHATLTSPSTIAGGFAVGLAFALLRCRGSGQALRQSLHADLAPLRSLEWLLRHIGPPIAMALLHRYTSNDEGGEMGHGEAEME